MMKLKILNKANQYKLKATASFPLLKKISLQEKTTVASTIATTVTADAEYDGLSKVVILPVEPSIDTNIKTDNIKEGVEILGVVGNIPVMKPQTITTSPTNYDQVITPDTDHNCLDKVIVKKIDERYVIPYGTRTIEENGEYDVSTFKTANVNVIFTPNLAEKTILENGTYNASDDGVDGYSRINVSVENNDVLGEYYILGSHTSSLSKAIDRIKKFPSLTEPLSNGENYFRELKNLEEVNPIPLSDYCTRLDYMFRSCGSLKKVPVMDTKYITTMVQTFYGCNKLTEISGLDTRNVSSFNGTFYSCVGLITLQKLNAVKCTVISDVLTNCKKLVDFGGFENLGAAYLTNRSENYSSYTLYLAECYSLSEQSIINVFNNLYDIKAKGCKNQKIELGSTLLAKLTSAEGQEALANAQAKGWNIV